MFLSTRLLKQTIGRQRIVCTTSYDSLLTSLVNNKTCLQPVVAAGRCITQTTTTQITGVVRFGQSTTTMTTMTKAPGRTTMNSTGNIVRQQSTESSSNSNNGKTNAGAGGGLWNSASFWGRLGALAGWGMSGSAIYDAYNSGPEIISLQMTPVLIVYSSLFARWAWVVQPQNLLLCSCHIANIMAQCNQLRRVIEYKYTIDDQITQTNTMVQTIISATAVLGIGTVGGIYMRPKLQQSSQSVLKSIAAADAGPFTVHFWAPLSKWLISGASFLDLHRPTDQISIAQYTALTLTGFFFTRYALLVSPVNYMLCAVNGALFTSSGWHLGRKINADYFT